MAGRSRRSTTEVHRLLVDSAARVFTAKGYAAATADDIAAEAGVARSAIWRHFDDKGDLFAAAVVEPLIDLLEHDDGGDPIGRFYDQCVDHRQALVGLAVAGREIPAATMDRLERRLDRFAAQLGDPVSTRIALSAIVALAVFDQGAPSRDEIVANIAQLLQSGQPAA